MVARNPLGDVATEPKRYQVSFLSAPLAPAVAERLQGLVAGPEALVVDGREIYAWHPAGVARSKLWNKLAGGSLGVTATARNWTTVGVLAEMTGGSTCAPYVIADVFTDTPLEGNPVAVFTDGAGLSGELMQRAARELNLSETVFVLPSEEDGGATRARIFTPATELPVRRAPGAGHRIRARRARRRRGDRARDRLGAGQA